MATVSERQELLIPRNTVPVKASVIGCGGVGTWVALFLVLAGVKTLYLYDPDNVDITTLGRTPYLPSDVGTPKVIALKALLRRVRSDVVVHAYVTDNPTGAHGHLTFDCTDSDDAQEMIRNALGGPSLIRAGCDGWHLSVFRNPLQPFDAGPPDQPREGYFTPSWVGTSAMSAALAVSMMFKTQLDSVTGDVDALTFARREV